MNLAYDHSSPGTPLEESQMIPSEFIEAYIKRFFMVQLEALAYGLHQPEEVRNYLRGVSYFVDCSCGIHARFATDNVFGKLINLTDDQMIGIARKVFKN